MPTKLGQNFLRDTAIIQKIIKAADLKSDDFVIEIGPGEGVLTEALAKNVGKVLAVEIDQNLIPALQKKFADNEKVEILNADILKINLKEKIPNSKFQIQNSSYKVVANIPYYITSPIIRLFLESEFPPQEMILMVQKEVAERIVASPSETPAESRGAKRISRGKPGQMSLLALSVQYYAEAQILFLVPAKAFFPIPKVDSAVIKIVPSQQFGVHSQEETKRFFRMARAGFAAKRKTLANNLANSFHLPKKEVENKLNSIGLPPLIRAQELSVEDWNKLAKII